MTKYQLQVLLDEERERNQRLIDINNIAIGTLNDLACGLGRKRDGVWSAAHLAADKLAELAKKANR